MKDAFSRRVECDFVAEMTEDLAVNSLYFKAALVFHRPFRP